MIKKFAAYFVTLSLLVATSGAPLVALAISVPNLNPLTGTNSQFLQEATGANAPATSDPSQNPLTVGCQSGSVGGSLGGISAQLQSAIQSIIPGQAGSVVSSLAIRNLPGIVGQLTGSSVTGQAISALLSGNLGGIANNLLGSTGLGNLLGGSGIGGSIGSALGLGGLGGIGGALGMVGGLLGGGEVPVNDAQVRQYTNQIQNYQAIYNKKVCVQDVTVRQIANQTAAQFAQTVIQKCNTGNGGSACWAGATGNISQENATLANTVFNQFVNNLGNTGINKQILAQVQNNLVANHQQQTDLTTQLTCPIQNPEACRKDFNSCPGTTAQEKWQALRDVIALYPQCTASGATRIAQTAVEGEASGRVGDRTLLIMAGNGILPPITCNDAAAGGSSGTSVPDYQCNHYTVTTAPAVTTQTVTTAVLQGEQKQANASQIGQLVNNLLTNLAQTALTSLTGMVGLSQQNTRGTGSYLDQTVNGTNTTTVTQAVTALQSDIQDSATTELAYETVLNQYISALQDAKTALTAAACLVAPTLTKPVTVVPTVEPSPVVLEPGMTGVAFTRFALAASSTAPVALNSVTVARSGASTDSDIVRVYLVDEATGAMIGTAQALNGGQAVIGTPITIPAGTTESFLIEADTAARLSNGASETIAFSVMTLDTSGALGGSLPIAGTLQSATTNTTATASTPQSYGAMLTSIVEPQLQQKTAALTASQNTLSQLEALNTQLAAAQTTTDVNTLSDEYQALISSGALHTTNDVQFLTNDYTSSTATLNSMTSSAAAASAACPQSS